MSGPKRVDRTLVSMKLPDWLIEMLDETAASYGLSRTGAVVLLSRIGQAALANAKLPRDLIAAAHALQLPSMRKKQPTGEDDG